MFPDSGALGAAGNMGHTMFSVSIVQFVKGKLTATWPWPRARFSLKRLPTGRDACSTVHIQLGLAGCRWAPNCSRLFVRKRTRWAAGLGTSVFAGWRQALRYDLEF